MEMIFGLGKTVFELKRLSLFSTLESWTRRQRTTCFLESFKQTEATSCCSLILMQNALCLSHTLASLSPLLLFPAIMNAPPISLSLTLSSAQPRTQSLFSLSPSLSLSVSLFSLTLSLCLSFLSHPLSLCLSFLSHSLTDQCVAPTNDIMTEKVDLRVAKRRELCLVSTTIKKIAQQTKQPRLLSL